jgi:hypothetical protein
VKEISKLQEKGQDIFKYQFPFGDGGEKPFLISPVKVMKDMNKTI